MKTTSSMALLSLAARAQELRQALVRLRRQYHQAHAKVELGPPRDPLVTRQRTVAHRQLTILVPMYRALVALAQQDGRKAHTAKAQYLEQFSKAVAMVDRMVSWVDGSEEEYGELLNLRVPADVRALYAPSGLVAPLRHRMEAQRRQLEAQQVACATLVSKLVKSFTLEQRELIQQYHRLSRGADLRLLPAMLLERANA